MRLPSGDQEKLPTLNCSPLVSGSGFGQLLEVGGQFGGHLDQPEMIHRVVAADDLEVAVLLLAILLRLGVGAGGSEGDRSAVGRPGDSADAVLLGGELRGLAARRRDQVDLALAVAVADEGEAARIGRPLRRRWRTSCRW